MVPAFPRLLSALVVPSGERCVGPAIESDQPRAISPLLKAHNGEHSLTGNTGG